MKAVTLILTMFLAAVSAAGQVTSVGLSSAQVRDISVREFDDVMVAAFGAVDQKVRRITATVTEYEKGKEKATSVSEYEYLPPDRFRSRSLSMNPEGSWEYIQVADEGFIRHKEGIWESFALGCSDIPPYLFWRINEAGLGAEILSSQVREDKLNGSILKRFSRERVQRFENPKSLPQTPPMTVMEDVWIGSDGLIIRGESIASDEATKNVLQKWVLTYEYDPKNIKINAPMK